jgi:biotin carboxyl carrier protein
MMFTYIHNGDTVTVQLERLTEGSYRATIGGRIYHFSANTIDNGWVLEHPESGTRTMAYVVSEGDTHSIHVDGETVTLTRAAERKVRRASTAGAHSGDVTAQMPGQIRDVLISEGSIVERGQALIILEAMKMEVRVTAPADGNVSRILVTVGEVVTRGQLLAVIEPDLTP